MPTPQRRLDTTSFSRDRHAPLMNYAPGWNAINGGQRSRTCKKVEDQAENELKKGRLQQNFALCLILDFNFQRA